LSKIFKFNDGVKFKILKNQGLKIHYYDALTNRTIANEGAYRCVEFSVPLAKIRTLSQVSLRDLNSLNIGGMILRESPICTGAIWNKFVKWGAFRRLSQRVKIKRVRSA